MKITIESTDVITSIDGVAVRFWVGDTESGIPVRVYVHRVEVRDDQDFSDFQAQLKEIENPKELKRRDLNTIPWML